MDNSNHPVETDAGIDMPEAFPVRNILKDLIETILLALVFYVLINFITARIQVESVSMQSTLEPGDLVLVWKPGYWFKPPERGEIIVFHYPRDPSQRYIKRVIGLPGEEVTIGDGNVLVDGVKLEEPYLNAPPLYNQRARIAEDEIFVLGDNRNRSSDSHVWGTVPLDLVIGKAILVYWPLDRFGFLSHSQISTVNSDS